MRRLAMEARNEAERIAYGVIEEQGESNRHVATLTILRIGPSQGRGEKKKVTEAKLILELELACAAGVTKKIRALVDTGDEVNLIRRGALPPESFVPAAKPIKLKTASR